MPDPAPSDGRIRDDACGFTPGEISKARQPWRARPDSRGERGAGGTYAVTPRAAAVGQAADVLRLGGQGRES